MAPKKGTLQNNHFLLHLWELNDNFDSLPTNRDVLGHMYKLYDERSTSKMNSAISAYFDCTIKLLIEIWQNQNEETIQYNSILRKLRLLLSKYQLDMKLVSRRNRDFDYIYEVFDIRKVLAHDEDIDNSGAEKAAEEEAALDLSDGLTYDDDDPDDSDYAPEESEFESSGEFTSVLVPKHSRYFDIDEICRTSDRRNISARDAAHLVSQTLSKLGLVTKKKPGLIVDKNKVQYSSKKVRVDANANVQTIPPMCLQFDGKAIRNLKIVEKQNRRQVVKNPKPLEHVVIMSQPSDKLVGFVTSESSSKAEPIFNKMLEFLRDKGIPLQELVAMGCDAAPVNVGKTLGIIRRFEEHLGKPLHWLICLLHMNERTLGNVITFIDGKTTGPHTHMGKIMKTIPTSHTRPAVQFQSVTFSKMPTVSFRDLTNDQKYLLQIASMVHTGVIDEDVCAKCPGRINNSRWMTTASRILREYVSSEQPTQNMVILVKYIMKVYIPVWFQTKIQPSWFFGSKHLFDLVQYTRDHVPEVFSYVEKCVVNNSFFAHPENMLLAMIVDANANVRQKAFAKIIASRSKRSGQLRIFELPTVSQLNFQAENYDDFLIWGKISITEPPITRPYTIEQLRSFKDSTQIMDLPHLPVHTQACENRIQALTESVTSVAGAENQEGHLRNKLNHRKLMGVYNSKKDFTAVLKQ